MLIVYQPVPSPSAADLRGKQEDTLALTWEQRRWVRGRFTTTHGREIALALPTGTPLAPGAILLLEREWYVRVEALPESVLAVRPCDHPESVRLAFEIGNRHFPLALDGDTILVPDDPAMAQLFHRLNVPWQRRRAIFSPVGNTLAGGSRPSRASLVPYGPVEGGAKAAEANQAIDQPRPTQGTRHPERVKGAALSPSDPDAALNLPLADSNCPFLRLLQFSDGLFPAGGYAHSFGLETLVQSGRVKNADHVASFLYALLENSAAPTDAAAALGARNYALAQDLDSCLCLDQMLDALKPAAELRQASRQLGRQTLRVLAELSTDPFVARFAAAAHSGAALGHHPVVFGIAAAAFAWPPRETASALLYSASAMIVGASLRLLPLGQMAGQRILAGAGPIIAELAEVALAQGENDLVSFTPEIEIAAMRHECLDARLFRS